MTEDNVFRRQLEAIAGQYQQGQTRDGLGHILPGLTIYTGTGEMPDFLSDLVGPYPLGYHELQFDRAAAEYELQFVIQNNPNSNERIYFIYDVSEIESSDEEWSTIISTLILSGVVVSLFGVLAGYVISRKIVSPLKRLTREIELFSDQQLPTELAIVDAPEEIRFLGQTLCQANQRINQFILREKEFTRNASHELRTPLTVIKGAAELLEKRYGLEQSKTPAALKRISRSVNEMELVIDTFLMLAREDDVPPLEKVDLNLLLGDVITEIENAISTEKKIEFFRGNSSTVMAPPQIVHIVVSNLVRNAIQHSSGNSIKILISDHSVEVSDNGDGITEELAETLLKPGVRNPEAGGSGFGLAIVDRICTRLGWKLDVKNLTGKGTAIVVLFKG